MSLIVQKYGGSSLADAESIKYVAKRVVETQKLGNDVVVVVSAMGDTTDELLDLAQQVASNIPAREMDMLLTAGERISMALLAIAINDLGFVAQSFTGSQAGMITDDKHGKARIIDVDPARVSTALKKNHIAIVAGFQGVSSSTKDITTLGRGGSDTTAVALSAALNASVCEIYTDVDGVYTADPRVVTKARKIAQLNSEEMLEMAASGAKVLHLRCVEYAKRYKIPIHVRSSFTNNTGTWIIPEENSAPLKELLSIDNFKESAMEQAVISAVTHDSSEAKITIIGVPDIPGKAASIFEIVSRSNANIDMIVQNVSAGSTGTTDISFTLPTVDAVDTLRALEMSKLSVGFEALQCDDQIGKLSLIGAGMRSNPGVSAKFFAALRDEDINIEMISTSDIRISIVTRVGSLAGAVRAVHTAFGLDGSDEAQVYAGTGR